MQIGVVQYVSNWRGINRGGGADLRDLLSNRHVAENCSELCFYGMMWGGLWYAWYSLPVINNPTSVYYFQCMAASSTAPLNGLRVQLASQFNTVDIDPTIPKMNVTDWKACLCTI